MIIAAVVGIFAAHPTVTVPAFIGWKVGSNYLFPTLFITIACGAISGFHSLIGSGTTSKQLDNEKDALLVGYGSMLIECVLAVVSLIAVATLTTDGQFAAAGYASPTAVFATAISGFFATIGFSETAVSATYTIIALAVSCFCLTSLDTGTRLGRFMFQELFAGTEIGKKLKLDNMYVATIITAFFGFVLCLAGYQKVWPLFGACNQLVAVPAFLAIGTYLKKQKKNNKMLYIPIVFMSCATLVSLFFSFKNNVVAIIDAITTGAYEGTALFTNILQTAIIVPIVVLAIILIIDGGKVLWGKESK